MIRIFDFFLSLVGLILLSPLFFLISILIKLTSRGPVFFKQQRVGIQEKNFTLYKFRSMKLDSDKLGLITVGGRDPRITQIGFFLRKYKLDELPQLINVVIGEMSLVGPRPEVRKYVQLYTPEQKKVLSILPGITDWASIYYCEENIILGQSDSPDIDYVEKIMPDKLKYNMIFIERYGLLQYFKIIFYTLWHIFFQIKIKKNK